MRTLASISILSLLVACSGAEPAKERPSKPAPSKPAPPPSKPAEAPAMIVDEPVPTSAAPTNEWWCLCYSIEGKDGVQPSSACRRTEAECRALQKRVAKGGKGIVANSLTHDCRKLEAEHPGDLTGGRDRWKPSKVAGAWASDGACLLAGEPSLAADTTGNDSMAWFDGERLGELRLGLPAEEVIELLGQPVERSRIEEEAATGDFVQTWEYPDRGLHLGMAASSKAGPQSLNAITAKSPCALATRLGVAIGSTRADVEDAYGAVRDRENVDPDDRSSFVAGSVYGGIIFRFDGDTVSEIFMGAAAE